MSGWSKFRDLVPLLPSRGLPLGTKGRFYPECVCSIMLFESETWPVKEEDMIKLERNNAKMVRLMCNVRPEDRISAKELTTKIE